MGVDFDLEVGGLAQGRDECIGRKWIEHTQRIGHPEAASACRLGGRDDLDEELEIGARSILASDRHRETLVARIADHAGNHVERHRAAPAQLCGELHIRDRHRQIDHGDAGRERRIHVLHAHATPGDRRQRQVGLDDAADGGDLFAPHGRRAGFDLGDACTRQCSCDGQLLRRREGDARRLLAVAQRRVVEHDGRGGTGHETALRCRDRQVCRCALSPSNPRATPLHRTKPMNSRPFVGLLRLSESRQRRKRDASRRIDPDATAEAQRPVHRHFAAASSALPGASSDRANFVDVIIVDPGE